MSQQIHTGTQFKNSPESIDSDYTRHIKECQILLKNLSDQRLIEKLARPIPLSEKKIIVSKFESRLNELNKKMRLIKGEQEREHDLYLGKGKSQKSTRSKTEDNKK